ncbi:MAG: D-alanyl-D-alanine carboxypeptidase [Microbacteriaceae bacterium]|nr:D-alanyl-D-alanine carboxypeptidase [Microbacteriaceae bacterium]MCL2794846.1 D-alanyl-D-alanine carboxypeptidase [Microbacteriaceae bacterium]
MSYAVDLEPEPPVEGAGAAQGASAAASSRRRGAAAVSITATIVFLAIAAYVGAVFVHPVPAAAAVVSASATTPLTTAAVDPAWPAHGSAAIGVVGQQGLLGSHGSQKALPMASMTKTITALVLLDKYKLAAGQQGPTITFTDADVKILEQVWAEDGSWAKVAAGEKLTLTQALTAMMLPSANNYARSLAVWSYGSQAAFVKAANAWLKKHGFTHTVMTDPSGLNAGSVSTPADLVGIGELAIANPVLAAVVDTKSATLPTVGKITNTDPLIGQDGIKGVKTGYTDEAGHCLLFAATVDVNGTPRTFVGVVVGQPTYEAVWAAVPELLASYEAAYHDVDLTSSGSTVYGEYSTPWGGSAHLVAASDPHLEIYSAGTVSVKVDAPSLGAAASGSAAGTVTFTGPDGAKTTVPLRTEGALAAPSLWWKLTHPRDVF